MVFVTIPVAAALPPGHRRLPASDLYALRQGDLDHLCGLYAAINGIRLALAVQRPMIRAEVTRLYNPGIAFLAGRSELASSTLAGCSDRQWHALLCSLVRGAQRITGRTIDIARPLVKTPQPSLGDISEAIENAIDHGHPVLVGLAGRHDHYTVVAGYTPTIWRLYDSGRLLRLTREACGVDPAGTTRHVIRPGSLTVLQLRS